MTNKKKNFIILGLIVLLSGAALMLYLTSKPGTIRKKLKDFAVSDTGSITKIFMADKNNHTILMERMGPGEWKLNNKYRVRKSGIDMLLGTFQQLRVKAPVPNAAHDKLVARMAAQSVKVEIYQNVYRIELFKIRLFRHEKRTKTYYVGDATQNNMGTYMLMEGESIPFIVHILGFRGFVASRYSTFLEDWRDQTVFRTGLNQLQSVRVEIPGEPENSFFVENDRRGMHLYNLSDNSEIAQYDTLKLLNFITSFSDLRYEALVTQQVHKSDSILASQPLYRISVTDISGNITQMKAFRMPNLAGKVNQEGFPYPFDTDRLYASVNDEKELLMIQYFVFDRIFKPLSYFKKP